MLTMLPDVMPPNSTRAVNSRTPPGGVGSVNVTVRSIVAVGPTTSSTGNAFRLKSPVQVSVIPPSVQLAEPSNV